MKKTLVGFGVVALMFGGVVSASATNFGTDITEWDGAGVAYEDGEAEPGMAQTQEWDLEGVYQAGNELSMVGGFDFIDGVAGYGVDDKHDFTSGDLFISIDSSYGSEQSGVYESADGQNEAESNFGYEYVFDLNFDEMSYNVLALDANATTITAWYSQNEDNKPGSNPWRYESGGTLVTSGTFSFLDGLSDADTGFLGDDSHYALTGFDLSFLEYGQDFYSHFTMGCGNDNLMGHGTTPVPEPATMLLFGTGLVGLVGLRRRKKK